MLMLLLVVGPAHSALPIVTYQDYLEAFPHQGDTVVIPDESLEAVRQIALDVLYTHSQLSPTDPDRLCIPPNVNPEQVIPGYWTVRLNDTVRFDTKAGHPPVPSVLIRNMILSMFKRSLDFRCPGPAPVPPRAR
jgi:hypothetical protein